MASQSIGLENNLITWMEELQHAVRVLSAIDHDVRQQLLRVLLHEHAMSVKVLHKRLKLDQAVCSQHLAILRNVGLVKASRRGQRVLYAANQQKLQILMTGAQSLP